MLSIKTIFIFLVVSNLFALAVISYNYYSLRNSEGFSRNTQVDPTDPANIIERPKFSLGLNYTFDDPKLAAKALAQLDTFVPVPNSFFSKKDDGELQKYGKPYFGLTQTADYCVKNREAFVENTDIVFKDASFMTDTAGKSLVRSKVLSDLGHDTHPSIHANLPEIQRNDFIYNLSPQLTNFFTSSDMYLYKHVAQDFSCLAQVSNHIPGHSALEKKDLLAAAIVKQAKKFASKPDCFSYDTLFPRTFVLNDKTQCQEFFKFFESPDYRKDRNERGGISFIRKTISETGEKTDLRGINLEEEESLRSTYNGGASCGTVKKNQIIQYYVHNPLVINGKRFDFRVYMLAASTNPLIAYYHDGFLRIAVDSNGVDNKAAELTGAFLTSMGADMNTAGKYEVMSFKDFQAYLLKKGLIEDNNWLDTYLRPELKRAMIHLMVMANNNLLKRSSLYELYAVDFIMDTDLKLWFMEVDANPEFMAASDENERFLVKMLKDHFNIVNGLLKSRMMRVVSYINRNIKDGSIAEVKGNVQIKNLDNKVKEFAEIAKNYWAPEFEPGKENGFVKIMDDNYFGVQRFQWLIKKECIY